MKFRLVWTGLLALGTGLLARESQAGPSQPQTQPLPTPYPESRYQQMSTRSPFAVATATAAPAATPDFAAQLYVDGVAHIGDTDYAAIKSRESDKPSALFIAVGQSADGLRVDHINWSQEMGKSTVEVSKGLEKATLSFDQATLEKSPAPIANAIMPANRQVSWQRPTLDENDGPQAIVAKQRQLLLNLKRRNGSQ